MIHTYIHKRTLIYSTVYIQDCTRKIWLSGRRGETKSETFPIIGEKGIIIS